jgi:hypothetical protein
MLLVLVILLGGMWYWQSSVAGSAHPEVDYSVFYQWVNEDKVQSVLMRGRSLEGELGAAETIDGQSVTQFHTVGDDGTNTLSMSGSSALVAVNALLLKRTRLEGVRFEGTP